MIFDLKEIIIIELMLESIVKIKYSSWVIVNH